MLKYSTNCTVSYFPCMVNLFVQETIKHQVPIDIEKGVINRLGNGYRWTDSL